ncbi:MAG: hypothetical protein ACE5OP_12520 [Candidatus Glassbacteria bacterium]
MGIYVSYLDVVIKDNIIMYNECPLGSGYGGGILCPSGTIISGNLICRNFAGGDWYDGSIGGGIYGGSFIGSNNTIADNEAYYDDGLHFGGQTTSTISNSIIMGTIGSVWGRRSEY